MTAPGIARQRFSNARSGGMRERSPDYCVTAARPTCSDSHGHLTGKASRSCRRAHSSVVRYSPGTDFARRVVPVQVPVERRGRVPEREVHTELEPVPECSGFFPLRPPLLPLRRAVRLPLPPRLLLRLRPRCVGLLLLLLPAQSHVSRPRLLLPLPCPPLP